MIWSGMIPRSAPAFSHHRCPARRTCLRSRSVALPKSWRPIDARRAPEACALCKNDVLQEAATTERCHSVKVRRSLNSHLCRRPRSRYPTDLPQLFLE